MKYYMRNGFEKTITISAISGNVWVFHRAFETKSDATQTFFAVIKASCTDKLVDQTDTEE